MIITKTPFRISFSGGGTDLPSFYRNYNGCVLSTTINRYMYITIHPYFDPQKTALKYSEIEIVDNISDIQHSILNRVLLDMDVSGVEICSTADVPSGTGLGSSSAFTVGLLNTLYSFESRYVSKMELASKACEIEIEKLGNPIGKQDQYAAAYGGINFITFNKDDTVDVEPVIMKSETKKKLEDNLIMFYTGIRHNANKILKEQNKNISDKNKIRNLLEMCKLTRSLKKSLEENELKDFGKILDEGWKKKRELASSVTMPKIDEWYDCAVQNGASGGKLLGAGGGGFLLFYCEKNKQKNLEDKIGLKGFPFKFEHDGSSVIYIGDKYW